MATKLPPSETAERKVEDYRLRNSELEREVVKRQSLATPTLGDSKSLYQNVIENGRDGIAIIQEGFIRFANSQFQTLLGYTLEELSNLSERSWSFRRSGPEFETVTNAASKEPVVILPGPGPVG